MVLLDYENTIRLQALAYLFAEAYGVLEIIEHGDGGNECRLAKPFQIFSAGEIVCQDCPVLFGEDGDVERGFESHFRHGVRKEPEKGPIVTTNVESDSGRTSLYESRVGHPSKISRDRG